MLLAQKSAEIPEVEGPLAVALLLGVLVLMVPSVAFLSYLLRSFRSQNLAPLNLNLWDLLSLILLWLGLQLLAAYLSRWLAPALLTVLQARSELPPDMDEALLAPLSTVVGLALFALSSSVCVVVIFQMVTVRGQRLEVLGLRAQGFWKGLFQGCVIYLLALPTTFAVIWGWSQLLELLHVEPEIQEPVLRFQEALKNGEVLAPLAIALVAVGVAPVIEELIFRGVLFRWLQARVGTGAGVFLSALIFSIVHWNLLALLPVFVLGLLLALLFHRTGSLWAAMSLHASFNLGSLLISLAMSGN